MPKKQLTRGKRLQPLPQIGGYFTLMVRTSRWIYEIGGPVRADIDDDRRQAIRSGLKLADTRIVTWTSKPTFAQISAKLDEMNAERR